MEQIKDNLWKLNETQYLKKGEKRYSLIYPVRDPVTKKWNKKNLFHMDIFTLIVICLLILSAWSYSEDTKECREIVSEFNRDPIGFCSKRIYQNDFQRNMLDVNITWEGEDDGELNISLYS